MGSHPRCADQVFQFPQTSLKADAVVLEKIIVNSFSLLLDPVQNSKHK